MAAQSDTFGISDNYDVGLKDIWLQLGEVPLAVFGHEDI